MVAQDPRSWAPWHSHPSNPNQRRFLCVLVWFAVLMVFSPFLPRSGALQKTPVWKVFIEAHFAPHLEPVQGMTSLAFFASLVILVFCPTVFHPRQSFVESFSKFLSWFGILWSVQSIEVFLSATEEQFAAQKAASPSKTSGDETISTKSSGSAGGVAAASAFFNSMLNTVTHVATNLTIDVQVGLFVANP